MIVSNQFAIVPVPAREHARRVAARACRPAAAFTFSIFPYGSTNFVITDVIEGSHEAIVGPGQHQLLFANVDGRRRRRSPPAAPRTGRTCCELERRAPGAGHGRGRAALLPHPGARCAATRRGIALSNMGTPPWNRASGPQLDYALSAEEGGVSGGVPGGVVGGVIGGVPSAPPPAAPAQAKGETATKIAREEEKAGPRARGHRPRRARGPVLAGQRAIAGRAPRSRSASPSSTSSRRWARSRAKDMEAFAAAFARWDTQAIWGGSFVTKEGS